MDLSFLDKSSSVTPLLVQLYDTKQIYGLAKDKQPLARAELTSVVTDLLKMDLTPKEAELVSDVLIGLLRQAETDLRAALAERLAVLDNVPLRLVLNMANDEMDVAGSILRNSSVLGDLDLIYIIKSKGKEYWRAIAERKSMSEQIVNVLADTRDIGTAITLAENSHITLTEHAMGIISDLAQNCEDLAQPLLRRDEVGDDIANKLYRYVSNEMKNYIARHYAVDSALLIKAVDEVTQEFLNAAGDITTSELTPSQTTLDATRRHAEQGKLTTKYMLATLRLGQMQSFVAQFTVFTGLDLGTVKEILMQPNGQGLAVACKAFEVDKADFISIFLLTNRVRNAGRMVDLGDMSKAVSYYNRIDTQVARGIIRNSLPAAE